VLSTVSIFSIDFEARKEREKGVKVEEGYWDKVG